MVKWPLNIQSHNRKPIDIETKMTLEKITDMLYEYCRDRGASSKDILDKMIENGFDPSYKEDKKILDSIRAYKLSLTNLFDHAQAIYKVAYDKPEPSLDLLFHNND